MRFSVVGALCTAVHFALFRQLLTFVPATLANVSAFAATTQVNFAASYRWTWAARLVARDSPRTALARLLTFNATALVALGANSLAFLAVYPASGHRPHVAAAVATVASACVSYLLSSRLTFVPRRPRSSSR